MKTEAGSKFFCLIIFLSFFCNESSWSGEVKKQVDIVSYGARLLPNDANLVKFTELKRKFDVRFSLDLYKYVKNFSGDHPNLKKIVFFDYCLDPQTKKLPKHKTICFKWEAVKISLDLYNFYYRVYTFDDDLVDNKKFFKFFYPVLQSMISDLPPFHEKNLCSIIATNWTTERVSMVDFFATKPKKSLDIYGSDPKRLNNHEMYKGRIPGSVSGGVEKLNTLKTYRFLICFENTHTTPGYITEKIFDAFAAGCVPIYWGPENVEKYIPSNCFIDYRKFKNNEQLYQFITSMTEHEYGLYIDHIREFLKSKKAKLFSPKHFEKILLDAVMD